MNNNSTRKLAAQGIFLFGISSRLLAQGVIPTPMSVSSSVGPFQIRNSTVIEASGAAAEVADQLRSFLRPATGLPLPRRNSAASNVIRLKIAANPSLGPEGYELNVSPVGVEIRSSTTTGLFYGVQSLRQLLPVSAFGLKQSNDAWTVPAVHIVDKPRFGWRGLMLDVGRHFFPKSTVFKFIDLMAMHKLNSLHLHLTEDQGWRIEIKKYPKLTEVGSIRKESMLGPYSDNKMDGTPHKGYFTQEDIREIVAYAGRNHINVVPEIEMPGHCQAALAAYPELGNTNQKLEVFTRWGVNPNVYNADDKTISFLQDVLTEVMDLFPSKFIHVGGDEVPKKQWKESERAQSLMKQRGLKTEEEIQAWFIRQMDTFLIKHGRRLVGWDEILEGGLAKSSTVMAWRGEKFGITAAKEGHDVVMAPTTYAYFDFYQSRNRASEPLAIGGFLPLETVYGYDPVPAELTPNEAKHVLGAQAQLWSEYIGTPDKLEYMAFPRACALADAVWRMPNNKDFPKFREKLGVQAERLKLLGVNFRPLEKSSQAGVAGWKSGEVSGEPVVKAWDLTKSFDKSGTYAVTFQYTAGAHRLDVSDVELIADGISVSRDVHVGRTGGEDVKNVYHLRLPKAAKTVILRAKVRADGGNDSNGEIYVVRER